MKEIGILAPSSSSSSSSSTASQASENRDIPNTTKEKKTGGGGVEEIEEGSSKRRTARIAKETTDEKMEIKCYFCIMPKGGMCGVEIGTFEDEGEGL